MFLDYCSNLGAMTPKFTPYDTYAVDALIRLRKARGLSAQALATKTADTDSPITRAQIAQSESNQRKLSLADIAALAAALECSPLEFFEPGNAPGCFQQDTPLDKLTTRVTALEHRATDSEQRITDLEQRAT